MHSELIHAAADRIKLENEVEILVPRGHRFDTSDYVVSDARAVQLCTAAWESEGQGDPPLCFRLVGPPGTGKTSLAMYLASLRGQELHVLQGHEELTAEDLLVTAALRPDSRVEYIASPLLAAMIRGGALLIDEISKIRPRALSPLASVLDDRRAVYVDQLGVAFEAHPDFRVCATLNPTDHGAWDLAPWLDERTLPEIEIAAPSEVSLALILRQKEEAMSRDWQAALESLARSRGVELTPSRALKVLRLTRRLAALGFGADDPESGATDEDPLTLAFEQIVDHAGALAVSLGSDEDDAEEED